MTKYKHVKWRIPVQLLLMFSLGIMSCYSDVMIYVSWIVLAILAYINSDMYVKV